MPWDVAAIQPVACAPRVTFFGPVPDTPATQRSEGELPEIPSASDDSGRVAALRAAGRRATGIPPGMMDVAERKAALAKWHVILYAAFDAGIMHGKKGDLDLLVEEVLECKATATLEVRGGPLLLFMAWASRGTRRRSLCTRTLSSDTCATHRQSPPQEVRGSWRRSASSATCSPSRSTTSSCQGRQEWPQRG